MASRAVSVGNTTWEATKMARHVIRAMLFGCGCGFAVGIVIVLPFFHGKGELLGSKAATTAWEGINAPAIWFSHVWTHDAGLPPRGEIAWVIVPVVAILAQWMLIGLLGGCAWAICLKRNENK